MPKKTIEIAGRPITLDARPDRLDLRELPLIAPAEGWESDAIGQPLGVYYRLDRQSVVDVLD